MFDAERRFVLEEAKHSQDLTGIHELLGTWQFFALEEAKQPGWYGALAARAERVLRTGVNPGAVTADDLQQLLRRRCGQQVYRLVRPTTPPTRAERCARHTFGLGGAGQVVYLVLDDRREVHLLVVQWLG